VSKPRCKPPEHLSTEAQQLWKRLHRTYQFDLPASQLLLTSLCDSWEHERRCREALKALPLTVTDKHGGVRVHPLLVEARQAREQVSRLARTLRIHVEAEE
jgi:P27 family predicted phage terminase small subunit